MRSKINNNKREGALREGEKKTRKFNKIFFYCNVVIIVQTRRADQFESEIGDR